MVSRVDSDSHKLDREKRTQRALWLSGGVAEMHTFVSYSWFGLPSSASRSQPQSGIQPSGLCLSICFLLRCTFAGLSFALPHVAGTSTGGMILGLQRKKLSVGASECLSQARLLRAACSCYSTWLLLCAQPSAVHVCSRRIQ